VQFSLQQQLAEKGAVLTTTATIGAETGAVFATTATR
jgi:hypothetical protein